MADFNCLTYVGLIWLCPSSLIFLPPPPFVLAVCLGISLLFLMLLFVNWCGSSFLSFSTICVYFRCWLITIDSCPADTDRVQHDLHRPVYDVQLPDVHQLSV